jgi:putative Mg2+ transporter-C (MgtC) family protein
VISSPPGKVGTSRQLIVLLVAFLLTALIGLEREIQGKSAGLHTQAIVGTSAALIVLISKYGFGDVLTVGTIVLDPSRVAAQVVSGIGLLGAGLIITRRGAVHGLTTAAPIWECAAIGMASVRSNNSTTTPSNHRCAPHREANAPGGNTAASTTA